MKECVESEQKDLAQYKSLQEAVKDKNELKSTLFKNENHIKALETEVKYSLASCFFTKQETLQEKIVGRFLDKNVDAMPCYFVTSTQRFMVDAATISVLPR